MPGAIAPTVVPRPSDVAASDVRAPWSASVACSMAVQPASAAAVADAPGREDLDQVGAVGLQLSDRVADLVHRQLGAGDRTDAGQVARAGEDPASHRAGSEREHAGEMRGSHVHPTASSRIGRPISRIRGSK